jgi:hypothetical protein
MDPDPQANPQPPEPDQPGKPKYNHARTGRVARKTNAVREKINHMLLDGFAFKRIIEALGEDGKDLNDDIIGRWKAGGFQDWLLGLDRIDSLHLAKDAATDILQEKAAPDVQDASRTVASAQLYELLKLFDPTALAQALSDKPDLYFRLVSTLARLSEGEALCAQRRAQQSILQSKLEPNTNSPPKNLLSQDALKDIVRQTKLI